MAPVNLDNLSADVADGISNKAGKNGKTNSNSTPTTRTFPQKEIPAYWRPTTYYNQDGPVVDVMNSKDPPNIGEEGNPTQNIDESTWDENKWRNEQLTLNLPPTNAIKLPTTGNPCMDGCQQMKEQARTKCEILRQRTADALFQGGCPTAFLALEKTSNKEGCTEYKLTKAAENQIKGQVFTPGYTPTPTYNPWFNPATYMQQQPYPTAMYPPPGMYQPPQPMDWTYNVPNPT